MELSEELKASAGKMISVGYHVVQAIKADGGFKYRNSLPGPNQEKDRIIKRSMAMVYEALFKTAVLEDMIQNTPVLKRNFKTYNERYQALMEFLNGEPGIVSEPAEKGTP